MTLAPLTRVGSYEVGERIGAGGMGEVHGAGDGQLGHNVALKNIYAELLRPAAPARTLAQD